MAYGAILAAITLTLQVWWRLIPLKDWQEHRWQWIASFVLPFLIVLSVHVVWRLVSAPWRVYQDQEKTFMVEKTALETQCSESRRKLDEEQAKRGRPELMASFMMIMGERPQWWLYLKNSSSLPAVNVNVRDIRNGSKVLRFENPGPIHGTAPTGVRCYILENGIQERNNVMAIFDGQQFYGQSSPSLALKVVYSTLDNRASQKSWELAALFWYDRLHDKLEMAQQSIESI